MLFVCSKTQKGISKRALPASGLIKQHGQTMIVQIKGEDVMGNELFSDKEYKAWVKELKLRIRQSQIKASVRINSSMLELYWSIGADIVEKQAESRWGSGVIEQLSKDLRSEFSEAQGFSVTNLRLMKRFFSFYSSFGTKLVPKLDREIRYQVGTELNHKADLPDNVSTESALPWQFGLVPWRHHVDIFRYCDTLEAAIFFLKKTIENGWSRSTLLDYIKSDLYARQGKAPNNFTQILPLPQSDLVGEMLKDPYNFDFISLHGKYAEQELEDALVANVTKLLLELGQGFAFLGQQVPIMAGDKELLIDLLFYQVDLHCYVVVELKVQEFEAAFTGQLGPCTLR